MGWLTGYDYRKSHLITASAGAGTNYQVGIKVYKTTGTDGTEAVNGTTFGKIYVGTKCADDFGDIRFTDDTGNTELDYWLDDTTLVSATSCTFWVEVSGDLSTVDKTIYIYYSKAETATTSNGTNTFRLFDHFDDSSISTDLWNVGGTGTATEAGTALTITSGSSANNHKYVTSDVTYNVGVAVEMSIKGTATVGVMWAGMTSSVGSLTTKNYTVPFDKRAANANFSWSSGDDTSSTVIVAYSIAKDTNYHRTSSQRAPSTGAERQFLDGEENSGTEYPTATNRYLSMNAYNVSGAGVLVVDWIAVRNYVASEPTHSTWGNEEVPFIAQAVNETLTQTGTTLKSLGKSVIEALTSTDVQTQVWGIFTTLSESLGFADIQTRVWVLHRTLTSTLNMSGAHFFGEAGELFTRSLSEAVSLIGVFTRQVAYTRIFTEGPTLTSKVKKYRSQIKKFFEKPRQKVVAS